MTDDLIEWLLDWGRIGEEPKLIEAAARIKKLEAALNSIADVTERWKDSLVSQVNEIARKALEGKDD
jgi:hypothetical protein